MEYLYTSIVFWISVVEAALFYRVVCRRKLAEINGKQLIPIIVLYMILILVTAGGIANFCRIIIIIILYYFVGCIFTQTGKVENIKYWLVCFLMSGVTEQIIFGFFEDVFEQTQGYGIADALTCISIVIVLSIMNKILSVKETEETPVSSRFFIILIPIIGTVAVFLSYMAYMVDEVANGSKKTFGLLSVFVAMIAICIAVMVLLYIFQQKEHFRVKADLEREYNEQQREYFRLMLEKERETRRFRHDIVNHLICIQNAVRNSECKNADSYLNDLLSEMSAIREKQYDVGNEVVNVLINYYLLPIRNVCQVTIDGYLGDIEHISQMDMCTVFSNVLKNAVEAIGENGEIIIQVVRKEKFAEVIIKNSYKSEVCVSKEGKLETTKSDKSNHGFGLENVQRTVQKNQGRFQYKMNGDWFEVDIILPILTVHDRI